MLFLGECRRRAFRHKNSFWDYGLSVGEYGLQLKGSK